jgi:hypothetical protein
LPQPSPKATSPRGLKQTKDARFDLLPWDALWTVARIFGFGASKYAERNWENGLRWSSSHAALQRHLALWWAGEDSDPESQLSHIAHVAWHGLVLLAHELRGIGIDDRPTGTESLKAMEATLLDERTQ